MATGSITAVVPAHHALPLELVQTIGDGGAGEADLLRNLRRGGTPVLQEESDDAEV